MDGERAGGRPSWGDGDRMLAAMMMKQKEGTISGDTGLMGLPLHPSNLHAGVYSGSAEYFPFQCLQG